MECSKSINKDWNFFFFFRKNYSRGSMENRLKECNPIGEPSKALSSNMFKRSWGGVEPRKRHRGCLSGMT